ncbi:MAG: LamG domain-containing protein [Polyangiales bacterium]
MVVRLLLLATLLGCTYYEDVIQSSPVDGGVLDASVDAPLVDAALDTFFADASSDTPDDAADTPPSAFELSYAFDEGEGTQVFSSNPDSPSPLQVLDPSAVRWIDGAMVIESPTTLRAEPPLAFYEACVQSGELTVEAWVTPAERTPTSARIMSSSIGSDQRNFTLDQGNLLLEDRGSTMYVGRIRANDTTTPNGIPGIRTETGVARTALTHIVMVRTGSGRLRIYVDGVLVANEVHDGDFGEWDPTFPLLVGNENTSGAAWLGEVHALRLRSRAWSGFEVREHRRLGPE